MRPIAMLPVFLLASLAHAQGKMSGPGPAPAPTSPLDNAMESIRQQLNTPLVWAVSVDGKNWMTFEGAGQPATLTFMAGNPADPDRPVGGLRYFWDGPGRDEMHPCVRLVMRFTGVAKATLHSLDSQFTPVTYSSVGEKLTVTKKQSKTSESMIEFEATSDKFAPTLSKQDSSCPIGELRTFLLPNEKRKLVRVGLIIQDRNRASQMYDAIKRGITLSTTKLTSF